MDREYVGVTGNSRCIGLTGNFWLAMFMYCGTMSLRIASSPIFTAWTNQNIESNVRATILSMASQMNSLGLMTGGPFIGTIGTAISLPVALTVTGLARIPVALIFARLLFHGKEKHKATT